MTYNHCLETMTKIRRKILKKEILNDIDIIPQELTELVDCFKLSLNTFPVLFCEQRQHFYVTFVGVNGIKPYGVCE